MTFSHTRCSDTVCTLPRGAPLSGSLAWSVDPTAIVGDLNIESSHYENLCKPSNIVWDASLLTTDQISPAVYKPRPPLRLRLCGNAH